MGVSWHHVKALVSAHAAGVRFEKTLTLGRLNLFISPWELKPLLERNAELAERFDEFLKPYPVYAEPLFKLLGATTVDSMDVSGYESATVIHDLNTPVPDALKKQYDLVDDGGTLEHVFHFPTALKNCMECVKVGGHLMINTVANNNVGHGFYQFSPELFYRALSKENGFEVERMVLFHSIDGAQWYEVADPKVVDSRVELVTAPLRTGLWLLAKRTSDVPIFANPPQQSDYATFSWKDIPAVAEAKPNKFLTPPPARRKILQLLGRMSPALIDWLRAVKSARSNTKYMLNSQPRHFRPVDS